MGAVRTAVVEPVDADADRCSSASRRLVAPRSAVFEAITPVRRAALLSVPDSPTIAANLARLDRTLRRQLDDAFPDLDADTLDALDATLSWDAWNRLRAAQGCCDRSRPARARTHGHRTARREQPMSGIRPNKDQFLELASAPDEGPVVMLNLLKFKEKATDGNASGASEYGKYARRRRRRWSRRAAARCCGWAAPTRC